jgi:amidohydrolase
MKNGTVPEETMTDIIDLSKSIYDFAEIGSKEVRSSELLASKLKMKGFSIQKPFDGMNTAFKASKGSGHPVIGLLAEYDALPNGHSCGHNLISAWAYGVAIVLAEKMPRGTIEVYGTPSEEGIGEYSGSKVKLADDGTFDNTDVMFGMHPSDVWSIGSTSYSDVSYLLTFTGKAAHAADSPESGINALDAAVLAYIGINFMRDSIKTDKHPVIGMYFREAGTATNVVPERSVLEVDLRSTSASFLKEMVEKMKRIAKSSADSVGCSLDMMPTSPIYKGYQNNSILDGLLGETLSAKKVDYLSINDDMIPSGSTDEGNVSRVVPTGHIDVKISPEGTPGHSEEFRKYADPFKARQSLEIGIETTVNACLRLCDDSSILKRAKDEFVAKKRMQSIRR